MRKKFTFNNHIKPLLIALLLIFTINRANAAFTINSPANGTYYSIGNTFNLTTTGQPAGTSYIDFYNNGTYLITANPSTTTILITAVTPGTHVLTGKAYNSSGVFLGVTSNSETTYFYPAAPLTTNNSGCGAGPVTLTASPSDSFTGGTFNWYTAASGGVAVQSSISTTYTTPSISAATNYYVSYTYGGVESSTRTSVTATIIPKPIISTAPTSPATGLYLSYPFNGNANDVSGNANNGTIQGAAPLTTDRYGAANSAYNFNGSTQYISTATSVASPGPQTFSISVWFKTTSVSGGRLVGFGDVQVGASVSYDRHIYMNNSGQLYFGAFPGTAKTINTPASYNDGGWHHAVATLSGTNGSKLYVDGALIIQDATMTAVQSYAGYWRVGYGNLAGWPSAPTSYYFNGSLDDIAVYNSEISASQVYTLYGGGSAPVCTGNTIALQANTVAGATYSWTGPNSFTSALQNPTIANATAAKAGTYILTVTGSNGCTSLLNVTAVVNALPVATFTVAPSVNASTNTSVTYTGTDPATSTYSWDFGGGTPATGTGQGPFAVQWATSGPKTITLTITNSSGCVTVSTQSVTVNSVYYGNYAFSKLITLNNASVGMVANQVNFPVLVSIQDNALIIKGACNDAVQIPNGPNYDMAFLDPSSGTELNYQIESYNQATGTLLVWVKIPTLYAATNNTLTFYFGSLAPPVTHNTAFFNATWASDYQAVYHFNEAAYTGTVSDGTANLHTGTTSGMTSADLVAGKIGNAYSFNGSSKAIAANAVTVTGNFTLSAWVYLNATSIDQKIMTNQGPTGSSSGGYKLGIYSNNIPELESASAINRGSGTSPSGLTTGTWYYVQGVFNGISLSTYVNGAQYNILSTSTAPTAITNFYIGVGEGGNSYYFNGIIDEPRVSNVAKSSDWIKAEYADQNNPVTFTNSAAAVTTNIANATVIPGALTYTWTGATSTDPTVATNWNNTTAGTTNQLPALTGMATLVIPTGLTNYPSLTADASIYGLTVGTGASLNLNGHILSVACNIYNTSAGTINWNNNTASAITWNGALATQTYNGSTTVATAQLGSMTINNSAAGTVTINSGPLDIYNTLTLTKGNLVIGASPAALNLKSTATQTASVAAIPSIYAITGNVNVERYITGGAGYRGYRLLSSPVYTATVSSNNVYSINYLKNSMYLTGTSTSGGFDNIVAANPTLYLYRENLTPLYTTFLNSNFKGINKINNAPAYSYGMDDASNPTINVPVGNGYLSFFRGNRAATTFAAETVVSYVPQAVTLSTSGTLNQGAVTVKNWFTPLISTLSYTVASPIAVRGYNLVGNPYASSIDWETYQTTTSATGIYAPSVGPTVYELNPITHNYDSYQKGGAFTNHGSRTIASGQGFFVVATCTCATLTFNESAKVTTQNTGLNLFMGKPDNNTADSQYLRLQLAKDSINTDDILVRFNSSAKTEFDINFDANYKQGSGAVSLSSLSSDHIPLAINVQPLPKQSEAIRLSINTTADGIYQLNMKQLIGIPQLFDIWLMDAYKKDSLDMRHNPTYSFNLLKSDTNTFGIKRFSLVIRQNPAYAYRLLDFTATKVATVTQVQIVWKTEHEQNYTNFTVERSTDNGATFNVIGGLLGSAQSVYSLIDKNPIAGQNLYRLKQEDINNTITYSNVVPVLYSDLSNTVVGNKLSVYPNPASNLLNLNITAKSQEATSYNITITNSLGMPVKQATSAQTLWQTGIGNLLPGTYVIQVVNNKDKTMVGKTKFVKQ
ncbi:MAG: C-terminal target protein [Mucilaginibacter sp.]|nr:C-terminal target protein [Mucilaginibacter sp.]